MSYHDAADPECDNRSGVIDLVIEPKEKDLGGFTVRRVLPAPQRRLVGPFIFFDHMGPATFPPGEGIQVRPHPHIGLATITFLFEGEIMHRDSLGYEQPIHPGAVNLMHAGRGIVHSERAGADLDETSKLHGIQSWMALPEADAESAPDFTHFPAETLPKRTADGITTTLIMGEAFGLESPVPTPARTIYAECRMNGGAELELPTDYAEIGLYVVSGNVDIDTCHFGGGTLIVAAPDSAMVAKAITDSHVMIIGGESLGKRHIWWNFVASSRERIEQAKDDWREGRFDSVPGETEWIPLPE
ncbi:MAG: pirin family protein [Pseudomonadota bacterium]